MLMIRYQNVTTHWLDEDIRANGFGYYTDRHAVFGGGYFSRHFGITLFDIFYKSYLFPIEDRIVTAIVCDIYEDRQEVELELQERAVDDEYEFRLFEKRLNSRLGSKKRNHH